MPHSLTDFRHGAVQQKPETSKGNVKTRIHSPPDYRKCVMPLLNHFLAPLSVSHPWRGFHSAWATAIARQLNDGVLPPRFYAIPNIDLGGPVEIDVATLKEDLASGESADEDGTVVWAPPAATVAVEFPVLDLIEVQVFYDEGSPRLTAAVECAA
jgi:hypothetical protein